MVQADDDRYGWERRGTFEVAAGVYRIPLPLPGDGLKAVNVYAVVQPDGLVLIDAGWALGEARSHLEEGIAALGHDLGDVRRVLVTHVHRDHYELGMVLRKLFGARLALGIGEQPSLQGLIDRPPPETAPMTKRMLSAGAMPLLLALAERREKLDEAGTGAIEWTLPDEWLHDRQSVDLDGDRHLEVIATPGHTQGHVVFVDHDAGLLFSGDHVLPHITPSIGFEHLPVESCLADYLTSLARIAELPDLTMLPAHGPPRDTTHDRIDELLIHHEDRLRATHVAVEAGHASAFEVAGALPWTRRGTAFEDLDPFNRMLAVNETAAHLDVLVRRELLAVAEVDGVRRYST